MGITIKTDNSTDVAYINFQGSTQSRKVIFWSCIKLLSIPAMRVPTVLNRGGDLLSQGNPMNGKWKLQVQVVEQVLQGSHRSIFLVKTSSTSSFLPVGRKCTSHPCPDILKWYIQVTGAPQWNCWFFTYLYFCRLRGAGLTHGPSCLSE